MRCTQPLRAKVTTTNFIEHNVRESTAAQRECPFARETVVASPWASRSHTPRQ